MSIFDPEPSDPSELPAKKQGRSRGKKSTAPKHAAPAAEAPQEQEPSSPPAPKRAVVVKKEKDAVAAVESAVENAGESANFRVDKGALTKMTNVQIQAELVKRDFNKAPPPRTPNTPRPPSKRPARALSAQLGRAGGSAWQREEACSLRVGPS